jgi:GH25 family lysozyme M1 (1,4-beta-N-acetylmuramidase)
MSAAKRSTARILARLAGAGARSAVAVISVGVGLAIAAPASFAAGSDSDRANGSPHAAAGPTGTRSALTAAALPNGYPLNGIDVSSHDQANRARIDWVARKASGDDFAFVKATEGTGYSNPYYSGDYNGAKNAGLPTGAYAFARPDLGNPVGQANYFVDHIQWADDGRTLPPFLDLEWPYSSLNLPSCYGLGTGAMVSWISSFLGQVNTRIGRTPMIYTNVNWWNACTGSSTAFADYPLDISSCDASPPSVPGWGTNWTFWQYDVDACGRGADHDSTVSGGSAAVFGGSAAVFGGSAAQLAALAGANSGGGANALAAGDVTGDGRGDLLARQADGSLMLYTNNGNNNTPFTSGIQIGSAWQAFTWYLANDVTGDGHADIIADRSDGTVWLYTNTANKTTPYTTGTRISTAGNRFTNVTLADITADGHADLIATKADGTLWLYTNSGNSKAPFATGTQIGTAWTAFNRITAADLNADGHADLLATKPDGTLWRYTNSGNNNTPYTSGTQIGTGWQAVNRLLPTDVNADGHADIIATKPDGTLWLYTNTGNNNTPYTTGTQIGTGWQNFA